MSKLILGMALTYFALCAGIFLEQLAQDEFKNRVVGSFIMCLVMAIISLIALIQFT